MTCSRCLPNRPCFNCQRAAELKAILDAKDRQEAEVRGRIRYERNSREVRGWA